MTQNIPVPYNAKFQSPIPDIWRDKIIQIVEVFKNKDFARLNTIPDLQFINLEFASQLAENIDDYGANLISLPKESWDTSICIYMTDHFWNAIIDLFTIEEGLSDLILDLRIHKESDQFRFEINDIYVP